MTDLAISIRNVSKCYRLFADPRARMLHAIWPSHTKGMREIWALKNINFDIKRGEAVALIGRNGSGKSSLLEILTSTLTPTTGDVTVQGRVSALLELGSGFNPEYTGRDNVMLNGLLLGLTKEEILARFDEILAFAEIGAAIDQPVKTYSSGMMMRLAFAVQVLCEPDILIIDEALSVGDFFFQQKCLSFIRSLCARGVTLLFVSHDMSTVRDLCERGIVLNQGTMQFDGNKIEAIRTYLNTENAAPIAAAKIAPAAKTTTAQIKLENPIWSRTTPPSTSKTHILAVSLCDEIGAATHTIRMGAPALFKVHYKAFSAEPIHVHLVIKNKYDQIVTAVGSLNLKLTPPALTAGDEALFELTTNLALEAGNYTFAISLNQPSACQTSGAVIDETSWIGPIHVQWDYAKEIPPFFGACGMQNRAAFTPAAQVTA